MLLAMKLPRRHGASHRPKKNTSRTLAVFWSLEAPLVLPSLPGIGSDPVNIGSITFPKTMWEKDDRKGCKYTPMTAEELAEPATPRRPRLVRKTPDVGQELWHPVLANSEHAYGWWMLAPEELDVVVAEVNDRAERTATSRMAAPKPKQQVVIKKSRLPNQRERLQNQAQARFLCPPSQSHQ